MNSASISNVPAGLASHLHDAYGLAITSIAAVPKGEDADAYRATASDGEQYFVRVEPGRTGDQLEVALAAAATLRDHCGLTCIVGSLPTTQGTFTSRLAASTVAVFPFVDGVTAYDRSISEPDWSRLATMIAALHTHETLPGVSALPRETFANPFAATIRHAVQRAATMDAWPSSVQEMAAELLLAHRADIEQVMRQFEHLGERCRNLSPELVVTHGDPNLSNVLLDDAGTLWLIDWGGLGLGPRERDLFAFTGDRFAGFLETYLDRAGPVRLHLDLFDFYAIRWVLQEIADYSSHLLIAPAEAEAQAHAWRELQPYLPIPHAALAADRDAVHLALAPFVRSGLVTVFPPTP